MPAVIVSPIIAKDHVRGTPKCGSCCAEVLVLDLMPGTYCRRVLLAILGAALIIHLGGLAWPPYKTGLFCAPASAAVLDARAVQSETLSNGLRPRK